MAGRALAEGLWGPRPEAMTSLRMASAMASAKAGGIGKAPPFLADLMHFTASHARRLSGRMLDRCWTDAGRMPYRGQGLPAPDRRNPASPTKVF